MGYFSCSPLVKFVAFGLPCCAHISITHDEVVLATWVMSEPDPKSHLATCFLGPFLVLFVLVKGLKETDAKRNRCANDLLGERPGKDKGGETKRRWKKPSGCNAGLTPVKKREKGGLDRENLRLQCNSGQVSARLIRESVPKSKWPVGGQIMSRSGRNGPFLVLPCV